MANLESSGHKIGHKRESVADMKRQKRTYRPFEVDEALLMYAVSGSMASAAGRIGIPEATLYSWIPGANGKPGKYTERFKEIQGIKKGEREKQMSILLWYAFRGMLEHRQEAKFADFLRLWGTVMDKYIAQGGASTEAGDILDHMMGYDEFRAGMLRGEFTPK